MRFVTIIFLLATCTTAWTEARLESVESTATVADGRTFGDGALPEHLAVYDVNTNGVLSVEEIQAMKDGVSTRHEDWVDRWDTNGNGVIDAAERTAAQNALRQQIEARRIQRFMEADSDGDDCLTFGEFSAIPAVTDLAALDSEKPTLIYNRLDANDDDCVTELEFTEHLKFRRVNTPDSP